MFSNSWTESFICDFYQTVTTESQVATTTRWCSLLQTRTHFQWWGEAKTRRLISSGSRGLSDYRPISSLREEACRALPHDLILTHCVLITATFIVIALTSVFIAWWCFIIKTPFSIHFRRFSHVYMKSLQYLKNGSLLQTACFFMSAQCSLLTMMLKYYQCNSHGHHGHGFLLLSLKAYF